MSNFGQAQEAGEGSARKVYTGVENFKITHVNPTQEELKALYGDNAKEPIYVSDNDIKDAEGNVLRTVPQIRIDLFLDNEDEEQEIKTRLSFFITKDYQMKTDGTKTQYINVYGGTAWLTPEDAASGKAIITMTGAKGAYHFDTTGMRKAYRGEEALISMMRNLLNLGSPAKAKDKSLVTSQFSEADWNGMFGGDVKALRSIMLSSPNKIGVLLGAKTVEGNVYQDVYSRNTLRQYSKAGGNFSYLRKDVEGAQANGAYGNTEFGDPSYKLSEYLGDAVPTPETAVGAGFGGGANSTAFDANTANAFTPQ
jgi:hypothetical protein